MKYFLLENLYVAVIYWIIGGNDKMDSSKIEDLVLSGDVTITVQMVTVK
jgi:hypothetical protein